MEIKPMGMDELTSGINKDYVDLTLNMYHKIKDATELNSGMIDSFNVDAIECAKTNMSDADFLKLIFKDILDATNKKMGF